MPFAAIWMDLEIITLNEVYQTEKDKYYMIPLICGILKKKSTNETFYKTEIESQTQKTNLWLARGQGHGRVRDGRLGLTKKTGIDKYIPTLYKIDN